MSALVRSIAGFERTVADLTRTEAFYRDGLGFSRVGPIEPLPAAIGDAYGSPGAVGSRLTMRLGRQIVAFLAFDPPGPQDLPKTSGGVTAYKFRDPDGHPLELIAFPGGPAAERWQAAPGLFLGIDHSAITVTRLEAALAFHAALLGFRVAQRGLNAGEAQARLDGVPDPVVDVLGLEPGGPATPHLELLHYRQPATEKPTPAPFGLRDRATTRLVLETADVVKAVAAIRQAGHPVRLSADGSTAYAEGPDGHGLRLVGPDGGARR
ncbi:VOC family protein [Methylobacterium sp. WL30]|uniref:VOC family protein n=1 Tax=Methylobacterium sp. WL30 TaxID=2603895 RepID=UPI0011CA4D15|nr:VOC family protein [Methylobacterium sp. WL30]TXN64832.1 VOC family protein [Methylobacterium sp. WL30]